MRTLLSNVISASMVTIFLSLLLIICLFEETHGAPIDKGMYQLKRAKRHLIDIQNPKEAVRVLYQLSQDIADSEVVEHLPYEKRGIDLGLSRGFSGSQAAKHLLGISAANLANGPGRKRRSIVEMDNGQN